ncbi:hypothetical protein QGM71_06075 [Virgibacillus sp. C22-A2]|uniref:DUF4878 domain-containing protein n=1 Tax=Virgibacillus tibetensis TaxID=3042313 RepID=A0ABU6KCL3_9BACI|nr:hypothetical protein [Virgibacillus sp. C22-A2]
MRNMLLLGVTLAIIAAIILYLLDHTSPERKAREAVERFYAFEKNGAFSESWAMFHPFMQKKFSKVNYLQDRVHVFMNHFEVTSFSYTTGEAVEIKNWRMEENLEPIDVAYKVPVSQVFKGKFGNFTIVQDVYVTMLEDEWKVLWDYGGR